MTKSIWRNGTFGGGGVYATATSVNTKNDLHNARWLFIKKKKVLNYAVFEENKLAPTVNHRFHGAELPGGHGGA